MIQSEDSRRERRKYIRIKKSFIISYHNKQSPSVKHEISQIKNISLGGSCFITSSYCEPSMKMGIELKTPYLAGTVHLDGTILDSHEKIPDLLYETRIVFEKLTTQAEFVLNKIVEYFKEEKEKDQ